MYQSVPSTFGISVMSGASRWLDAAARGGMTVNAAQKALTHTMVTILPAILLAFSIGSLRLRTVVPTARDPRGSGAMKRARTFRTCRAPPVRHRRSIYESGVRIGFKPEELFLQPGRWATRPMG